MAQQQWVFEPGTTERLDLGPITELALAIVAGNVTIIGHDLPSTELEISGISGAAVRLSRNGTRLKLDHRRGDRNRANFGRWFNGATVDLTVLMPMDATIKLNSMNANVVVSGIHGRISAGTVSGQITLDGCIGGVELNSASGEACLIGHRAAGKKVQLNTMSGNVTVGGEIGRLQVNAASAAVVLDLTGQLNRVEVNQMSGEVIARFDWQPLAYEIHANRGASIDGTQYPGKFVERTVGAEQATAAGAAASRFGDAGAPPPPPPPPPGQGAGTSTGSALGRVNFNNGFGTINIMHRAE